MSTKKHNGGVPVQEAIVLGKRYVKYSAGGWVYRPKRMKSNNPLGGTARKCSECNAWTERSLLDRLGLCPSCQRSYYA